jgi:hypothetical protein
LGNLLNLAWFIGKLIIISLLRLHLKLKLGVAFLNPSRVCMCTSIFHSRNGKLMGPTNNRM